MKTVPREQEKIADTITKRRVRTGCLNCRRKHKKCDEQKPVCRACSTRKDKCEWPDPNEPKRKRVKKNSNEVSAEVSPNNSEKSMASPEEQDQMALENYSKNLENIDNSLTVENQPLPTGDWIRPKTLDGAATGFTPPALAPSISLFSCEMRSDGSFSRANQTQRQLSTSSSSISPESTQNSNGDFQFLVSPSISQDFTLREYMFANASNFELSTEIFNPHILNDNESTKGDEEIPFLTQIEEKFLIKNFLYKVAPWLDMFDLSRQIGLTTVQLAKKSPCLRFAILALSARQKERTDPTYDPSKSVVLYQTTLKYLIPTMKKAPDITAISACVLLCVFEMMSISPEKWRYHLDGCSALFKATGINGFSNQYERALFWVFARMDVNSAVIGEQTTMISSDKWLPEGSFLHDAAELFKKEASYEMYANYMVFLCSRVVNLISSDTKDFDKEWELLWNEVNQWHRDRPDPMKSIIEFESSPFPEILYDNGPAISANQLYHMSMILLRENKPRLFRLDPKISKPPTWHAKQICSISLHNDHHGCWNNSVQALWVAGKLLTHKDEHRIILDLLNEIETTTGWAMKFRAKDLSEFWGQS
jgi:hypothetical protein